MIEQFGPRRFVGPAAGIGHRGKARRLGGIGTLRKLVAAGRGAHDIGLDDDVGGTANHQEMLDIVTPDQHQAAPAIDRGGIDHGKPGHPAALGVGTEPAAGDRRTNHAATPINARTTMNATMKVIGLPCILVPDKWRFSRAHGQTRQPSACDAPNCDFLTSHGKFCRPQLLITYESLDPKRLLGLCMARQTVGLMPLLDA